MPITLFCKISKRLETKGEIGGNLYRREINGVRERDGRGKRV